MVGSYVGLFTYHIRHYFVVESCALGVRVNAGVWCKLSMLLQLWLQFFTVNPGILLSLFTAMFGSGVLLSLFAAMFAHTVHGNVLCTCDG